MDNTTPTPDTGAEAGQESTQDNWEQRYTGLQKVVAKRDEALHTTTAELDRLRAENEAALAELNDYRQKVADESEEEQARAQFEALRERFSPAPRPIGNNAARQGSWYSEKSSADEPSEGFPI